MHLIVNNIYRPETRDLHRLGQYLNSFCLEPHSKVSAAKISTSDLHMYTCTQAYLKHMYGLHAQSFIYMNTLYTQSKEKETI